jgi:hypothetical protein
MRVLEGGCRDSILTALKSSLLEQADRLLELEATEFRITGPRMLENCQQVLRRVATLGLAFQISGTAKYLDRAKTELFAAADFPHWNPEHFLDTAELCTAFAIGYDWLHDSISTSDRNRIREALLRKGLLPGLELQQKPAWWVSVRHNWNTICNGGLAIGALALTDEEPDLAAKILDTSLGKMPLALDAFGPDGAWDAGPHYWEYTAWYGALTFDALATALGTDAGLSDRGGFHLAGLFPLHCRGTSGQYFNFADAEETVSARPVLFWLGKRFNLPNCIAENHRQLQFEREAHPFDLVWYESLPEKVAALPTAEYFRGTEVVFMRSAWNDSDASFLAFKAGSGQSDHAHLDLGSFVFDVAGIRWAVDLGPDDYDLPGYWESREGGRWKYYRLNNRSHNTLLLNGRVQNWTAATVISRKNLYGPKYFAIADLSSAYSADAESVHRGAALLDQFGILIQDEIVWRSDRKDRVLRWQLTTNAEIRLDGAKAVLSNCGRSLEACILSPPGARFSVASAHCEQPENPNTGYQQLALAHVERGSVTCVSVQLSTTPSQLEVRPLSAW